MSEWPLSWFEVNCDGSACGSGNVQVHVHPVQRHLFPGAGTGTRVTVRNGHRVSYSKAEGITRLTYPEAA
jgi:hypothetical protein